MASPGPPDDGDNQDPPEPKHIKRRASRRETKLSEAVTVDIVPRSPTGGLDEGGSTFADWEDSYGQIPPEKRNPIIRLWNYLTEDKKRYGLSDEQTADELGKTSLTKELSANLPFEEQVGWLTAIKHWLFRRGSSLDLPATDSDKTDPGVMGFVDPRSDLGFDDDSGLSEDGRIELIETPSSADATLGTPTEIPVGRERRPPESVPKGVALRPVPRALAMPRPTDRRFHTPDGIKRRLEENERNDSLLDSPTPQPEPELEQPQMIAPASQRWLLSLYYLALVALVIFTLVAVAIILSITW